MSKPTILQQAAQRLVAEHGSLRKAQHATGVNYAYLARLASGERSDPSDAVLSALGLERVAEPYRWRR